METTLSFRTDSTVAVGHNRREAVFVNAEPHIDPNGVHEEWRDLTELQAYEDLFGDALQAYNDKQSRDDRKMTMEDYIQSVKNDNRGRKNGKKLKDGKPTGCKHSSYEVVVTFGNKEELIPDDVGKEMMKRYVNEWNDRNPNLYLYGAYYHADEEGAPHVHLDFVPVAHGYKRGMECQSSIGKALKEMGYDDVSQHNNSYMAWQTAEREHLESIGAEYGFTFKHPCEGKSIDHKTIAEYKLGKVLADVDKAEKGLEILEIKKEILEETFKVNMDIRESISEAEMDERFSNVMDVVEQEKNRVSQEKKAVEQEKNKVDDYKSQVNEWANSVTAKVN